MEVTDCSSSKEEGGSKGSRISLREGSDGGCFNEGDVIGGLAEVADCLWDLTIFNRMIFLLRPICSPLRAVADFPRKPVVLDGNPTGCATCKLPPLLAFSSAHFVLPSQMTILALSKGLLTSPKTYPATPPLIKIKIDCITNPSLLLLAFTFSSLSLPSGVKE